MVTKKQRTVQKVATKRVNVGNLQLNKETIRDLSIREKKGINGGVRPGQETAPAGDSDRPTCTCDACG